MIPNCTNECGLDNRNPVSTTDCLFIVNLFNVKLTAYTVSAHFMKCLVHANVFA